MSTIPQLMKNVDAAKAAYLKIANTASATDLHAAHLKVKAAQEALNAKVTEGAKPCPKCKGKVTGIVQPGTKVPTYEIGCIHCKPIKNPNDGTVREFRALGGIVPKHTVEAWNGGPDFWSKAKDQEQKADDFVVPTDWAS